ncbi:MAG TPA: MFS transporter [Candidatus Paceibacterota bacterium]|nr:MFS transporter [Candidatus Paceibacterota bacterium]
MQKYLNDRFGITFPVFILSVVSFLNDVATDMIYPIIPIFLTQVIGAPVQVLGLIEGVAESTASFLKVAAGVISDKLERRKPFVVLGYVLSATAKLFFGFAYSWHAVLGGKFADRLGKGTRTSARDAFIAENSAPKDRGVVFGFHRGMDTLGAVFGPLIGIVLLSYFPNNFREIFLFSLIPTVFAIALLIIFIKEKEKAPDTIRVTIPLRIMVKNLSYPFFAFLLVSAMFAIGNSSDAFLILKANNLGYSLVMVVALFATFNFTYALLSVPAGIVADKVGPRNIMIVGFLVFGIIYLLFGYVQTPALLWVLFPLYGVYMAFTDGVGKAYISNIIPHEQLGTAYGIHQTVVGFCAFFASIIAGFLWANVSSSAPFIFGGSLAIAAAVLFLFVGPKGKVVIEAHHHAS